MKMDCKQRESNKQDIKKEKANDDFPMNYLGFPRT